MQNYIQLIFLLVCFLSLGNASDPGLAVNDLPAPGVCGSSLDNLTTDDDEIKITDYPWMVLIEFTKPNGEKRYPCGGALINKDYVLTASHCVNGRGLALLRWTITGVRLGEWDLSTDKDCDDDETCSDPVVDVTVAERIPHENYDPNSIAFENDIALLRLERSITFTDWIKPICLPISSNVNGKNYDAQPLILAGWGTTDDSTSSNTKVKVEINGVPIKQCIKSYSEKHVSLTDKQLCAGGIDGKDACGGDGGAPLVTKHRADPHHVYFYLAGLVSFGLLPCGKEGWPSVYTRVDQYTDWILSHMRA